MVNSEIACKVNICGQNFGIIALDVVIHVRLEENLGIVESSPLFHKSGN